MANLPNDRLPNEFEVIIYGTGLTESILAAAAARAGKSVLHIDGNSFYGELWGTLLHRDLEEWLLATDTNNESVESIVTDPPLTADDNIISIINNETKQVYNVTESRSHSDSVTTTNTSLECPLADNDGSEDVTAPLVTWDSLGKDIKRFNYDILPKLLYCRGSLVDVITTSGVSRYMEFKAVNKLYLYNNDSGLVQGSDPVIQSSVIHVPSSRSDVFNSKIVSMLDKRRLMKYLTFCAEYEQHFDEYEAYQNKPYREFLTSQGLSDSLCDFIIYSIAFTDNSIGTLEGLKLTHLFLNSLGRFGNAPFIYPLFGSGEIPQAFCRLCAVYGGVYCLKQSLKSIVSDSQSVKGIVCASGQRIKCSKLICHGSQVKHIIPQDVSESVISRAIYVTDRSLIASDGSNEGIALVTVPPGTVGPVQSNKIQLLQIDSSTLNTSQGTYMVHATYDGDNIPLLQSLTDKLFSASENGDCSKPRLLRTVYYNVLLYHVINEGGVQTGLPNGITVLSDPDCTLSYESCIKQAKDTFVRLFPGEEFLPKIPEPEDIIYDDYQPEDETPGDDTAANEGDGKIPADKTPANEGDNTTADKIPADNGGETPANEGDNTTADKTAVNKGNDTAADKEDKIPAANGGETTAGKDDKTSNTPEDFTPVNEGEVPDVNDSAID